MLNASIWLQNSTNFGLRPIRRGQLSGRPDRLVRSHRSLHLDRRLRQPDELDQPGHHAGYRRWIGRRRKAAFTTPWSYAGRADVFNIGTTYAVTCDLRWIGGVEYVRGENYFDPPATPNTPGAIPYTDLPAYSAVETNTYRLNTGFDYQLQRYSNMYFRYNYYDYDDA